MNTYSEIGYLAYQNTGKIIVDIVLAVSQVRNRSLILSSYLCVLTSGSLCKADSLLAMFGLESNLINGGSGFYAS